MAAWYGYPYERLPESLKGPVKWAIGGCIIGIIAAVLTGGNAFFVGLGMAVFGGTVGMVVESRAETNWEKETDNYIKQNNIIKEYGYSDLEPLQHKTSQYFQNLISDRNVNDIKIR